jgi:hypothetical protein
MRLRKLAVVLATALAVAAGGGAIAHAENIGNEGCTPGYWKNHTDNWEEYKPTTTVGSVWVLPPQLSQFSGLTFEQALQGGGGPGVTGAAEILLRASVAAYLNAAHEGLGYPYRRFNEPFNLEAKINAALASLDRDTMLALATTLDKANNLGCPLN